MRHRLGDGVKDRSVAETGLRISDFNLFTIDSALKPSIISTIFIAG